MAEEYYIFPRKGRKYLYVQFRDDTGKLGAAVSSGKTSEAAALRWAKEELKKRVLEAQARPRTDMLFGSWIEPFFGPACPYLSRKALDGKSYSKAYVRNSHYYVQFFILPDKELCALPLNAIRRTDVLAFRKRLVDVHGSSRTIARVLQVLKLVLNEAVYHELIDYSPASKVSAPVYTEQVRGAIDSDKLAVLLLRSSYASAHCWMATVTTAYTGMRAAEALALEWDCLDFKRGLVIIRQAFKDQTSTLGLPKSGKARVSPMPQALRDLLLAWKNEAPCTKWVFGYKTGSPLGYKNWLMQFKKAAALAGCPDARIHYLRHTLNTQLLAAGVSPALIRASQGWSSQQVQNVYTHAEAFDYSALSSAIDTLFRGQK